MTHLIPNQVADAYKALSDARNAMVKVQSNLNDDMQIQVESIYKHIEDAASELGALIGNTITNDLFFDTIEY